MLGELFKAGYNAYTKKKNKPTLFEHTPFGDYLKNIGKEGAFSPKARSSILGRASATASNSVGNERTRRKGNLISRGMGDSIAGMSYIDKPGMSSSKTLADLSAGLTEKNEMSKVSALERLAQGKNASRENKKAWSADYYSGLGNDISGLLNSLEGSMDKRKVEGERQAVSDGIEGFDLQRLLSPDSDDLSPDEIEGRNLLLKLLMGL